MSVPRPGRSEQLVERLTRRAAIEVAKWRQARALPDIAASTAWIEQAPPEDVLISVVMPTRNRAATIGGAIESVLAQRHDRWELLVADDGSEDGTRAIVTAFGDERIRLLSAPQGGVAHARNRALDAARGSLVCYLDDDNRLGLGWLHAVAWALKRFPSRATFYGARIVDGGEVVLGMRQSSLPQYHFVPFSRRLLHIANFIDIGVFAHRRELRTRFDEDLTQAADWDFVLRATSHQDPLPLPVVATLYSTSRPDRLSIQDGAVDEANAVRRRHAAQGGTEAATEQPSA